MHFISANFTFFKNSFINDTSEISGRVHSVFEHAVNLELNETLLTLLADKNANIPDSIVVSQKDFALLKNIQAQDEILLTNKKIKIAEIEIDFTNSQNFENNFSASELATSQEIENRRKLFGFYHELPERAEKKFDDILKAIKNQDILACENILKTLIGLGSGLTPSADDALLGISATLEFFNKCGINVLDNFADMLYKLSENRTTDVSRKYFKCACQKRYSLPLINVVRSLFENNFKFDYPALAKLLNTGHSSGKDTMRGILLAKTLL